MRLTQAFLAQRRREGMVDLILNQEVLRKLGAWVVVCAGMHWVVSSQSRIACRTCTCMRRHDILGRLGPFLLVWSNVLGE